MDDERVLERADSTARERERDGAGLDALAREEPRDREALDLEREELLERDGAERLGALTRGLAGALALGLDEEPREGLSPA